jgi:hypothetical protein
VKIEVKSTEVIEKKGTSQKGKPYSIREQHAYIDIGKSYPVEVTIALDNGMSAFSPGIYEITPKCFYVKSFGQVGVDLSKIQPKSTLLNTRTA